MKNKRNYAAGTSLVFGIVVLVVLIGSIDPGKLAQTVGAVRAREALAAAGAFCLAVIVLEGARIKVLFADYGLSFGVALKMTLIGIFFGNFTPAMVGAEIYKAHFVQNLYAGFAKPLILLFLLRVVGLAVTASGALLVLLCDERFELILESAMALASSGIQRFSLVPVLGLGGMILLLGALIGWARRSGRLFRSAIPGGGIIGALRHIRPLRWVVLIGLSALVLGARAIFLMAATRALAGTLGFSEGVLAAAGSVLAGALPLSFGGLGVQEGGLAGVLYALNAPKPTAVAVALLNRCLIWLAALAGGLTFLVARTARATSSDCRR